MQVYHHSEVEAFARTFYLPPARRRTDDHARLEAQLAARRDPLPRRWIRTTRKRSRTVWARS